MNTFLEKVTRVPKASSRIAAARVISGPRSSESRCWNSGNMTEHLVRGMIGNEGGKVGGRVDVARQARAAHDRGLDAGSPRMLGMTPGARPLARKGESQDRRRLEQEGVGAAVLRLGDHDAAGTAGLDQGGDVGGGEIGQVG